MPHLLHLTTGSRQMRLNNSALQALGNPETITISEQNGVVTIAPHGSSIVRYEANTNTFHNAAVQKQLIKAGYRKDRAYIGLLGNGQMTFVVESYEQKET